MARHIHITGANRGIGLAIAQRFVAAGDTVSTLYIGDPPPDGIDGIEGDVRDAAQVDGAFGVFEERHGPIEILVANAGITRDGLLMRMTDEDFEAVIDINLVGAFRCVRRVAKTMIRQKAGCIILIGSVVGLMGNPGQINYSSSKAALVGMARSITRELGGRGITANVIAPGFIDTAMTQALPEDVQQRYRDSIPAQRFGEADEVAGAAFFLASDDARYISGAVIPVDGGLGLGH
ncbi:MAG: 3-oxoacyl-ACP reductase FabG [Demequinaceae bacterium]|nr:3-oxoacyl-ACP reductase FabG [Demequinaceae bacterium]